MRMRTVLQFTKHDFHHLCIYLSDLRFPPPPSQIIRPQTAPQLRQGHAETSACRPGWTGTSAIRSLADDTTGQVKVPSNVFASKALENLTRARRAGPSGQTVLARMEKIRTSSSAAAGGREWGGAASPPARAAPPPPVFHGGMPYPSRPRPVSAPQSFPAWRITAGGFSGWKLARHGPSRVRQPELPTPLCPQTSRTSER